MAIRIKIDGCFFFYGIALGYDLCRNETSVEVCIWSMGRPPLTDVLLCGVLGADAEADDEHVVHGGRHHVQLARSVDVGQQLLVQGVGAAQTETDQAQLKRRWGSVLPLDRALKIGIEGSGTSGGG